MSTPSKQDKQEGQFFQLVLLLVNIIQGIALAALAAKGIGILEGDELSIGIIMRFIASFFVIWLITFEYAAFYVTIWPPTNGAFDIFVIMITGVFEYITIQYVGTPIKWLGFLTLLSGVAVISYWDSHTALSREAKMSDGCQLSNEFVAIRDNNIFCIRLTTVIAIVSLLLWGLLYLFRLRFINYIAPVFAVGYCGYLLWHNNKFLGKYGSSLKMETPRRR